MSPSRSASSTENPESTSPLPPPTPAPATSSSSLFTPTPSPSPSSWETSEPNLSQPPADAPSWSTSAPGDPSSSDHDASSDTPSTGSGVKVSKAGLRAAVGTGFRQACRMLSAFVAIEEERAAGVWEPDVEDIADVSKPAANIIYRRLPDEAKGGDVVDLLALGMAVVGYVAKNLSHRARVRSILALQAQQGIDVPQGETQTAGPTFPGGGF